MTSYVCSTEKTSKKSLELENAKITEIIHSKKRYLLYFVPLLCVALFCLLLVFVSLYATVKPKDIHKESTLGQQTEESGFRNRKLEGDITRAVVRASSWLGGQQDTEGKWLSYHITGYALSTLNLIGQDINTENKCVDLSLALNYIKKLNGSFHTINGGKLAYIIMGLQSLCINTSQFMGTNLTNLLFMKLKSFPSGAFNNPFPYSLAVIALRLSNGTIPWSFANKLIQDGNKLIVKPHGGDTMALVSMALTAIELYEGTLSKKQMWCVKNMVRMLLHKLEEAMFSKKSTMNLYTKSLVIQAFAAANKNFRVNRKQRDALYQSLLSQQKQDGSFGNLGAVLDVLPALAGTSFLDIQSVSCQAKNTTGNKVFIKVHVGVEFKFGNHSDPSQQTVKILNGSTAFDVLKAAAQLDPCYDFTYKNTSFGPSIQSICKVKIDPVQKLYWMFYVNGKSASVGVGSYIPKSNDHLIMKYKKVKF